MKFQNLKKKIIAGGVLLTVLLSAGITYAAENGAGTTVFQTVLDYAGGFTYTNTISQNDTYGREESYALTSQPGAAVKPIVLACDTIYGALNINKIVSYATQLGYQVVGAINSDFFDTSTGIPLGVAVEDGVYKSSPEGYNAVCFDASGNATIVEDATVTITLTNLGGGANTALPGSSVVPITEAENTAGTEAGSETTTPAAQDHTGQVSTLYHLNKLRNQYGGMVLLDEHFSTVSTRTSDNGWFVRFKILDGSLKTSGTMKLEVVQCYETDQPQAIGSGYMFLTADSRCGLEGEYQKYAVGDIVELTTTCSSPELANAAWATGAGDILAKNGQLTDDSQWTLSLAWKNPRSALGIRADGSVLYYAVDGRNSSHSNGLSFYQLATELLAQGCVSVVNFDGGGSTALAARGLTDSTATVKNSPSDGSLRKCATYVLLVNSHTSSGQAETLHLTNQNLVVFSGSSASLSYTAKDGALNTVATPSDVKAEMASGSGTINGNTFTAGSTPGMATLNLSSASTGAAGKDTVYVTNQLSSLTVKADGGAASSLKAESGQKIQLSLEADYYGKSVAMDISAVRFSISGGMGTVSDSGLITISENPSSAGWVKIEAGGVTKTLNIRVDGVFSDISGHWAENYITDLYERKIVNGSGNGTFSPDAKLRRSDFILMLYRAAGSPAPESTENFSDVEASAYYCNAVAWAKQEGIAQGDGVSFRPAANMTREEAFTFIWRYMSLQRDESEEADTAVLSGFSDEAQISQYARTAAAGLIQKKIINGSGGKLNPQGMLTRAEMAKILSCMLQQQNDSAAEESTVA